MSCVAIGFVLSNSVLRFSGVCTASSHTHSHVTRSTNERHTTQSLSQRSVSPQRNPQPRCAARKRSPLEYRAHRWARIRSTGALPNTRPRLPMLTLPESSRRKATLTTAEHTSPQSMRNTTLCANAGPLTQPIGGRMSPMTTICSHITVTTPAHGCRTLVAYSSPLHAPRPEQGRSRIRARALGPIRHTCTYATCTPPRRAPARTDSKPSRGHREHPCGTPSPPRLPCASTRSSTSTPCSNARCSL